MVKRDDRLSVEEERALDEIQQTVTARSNELVDDLQEYLVADVIEREEMTGAPEDRRFLDPVTMGYRVTPGWVTLVHVLVADLMVELGPLFEEGEDR